MSIIDRIRELFGGKSSGAEHTATTGGAVGATSGEDRAADVEQQSASDSSGGGEGGGGGGGGGDGSGSS